MIGQSDYFGLKVTLSLLVVAAAIKGVCLGFTKASAEVR